MLALSALYRVTGMVLVSEGNSLKEQSLLLDMFKAFALRSRAVTNQIYFSPKRGIILCACVSRSELPSNISTIVSGIEFREH